MNTQQQISDFLANQPIAMAGVSRNKKKFGYISFKELREKNLELIPINPNADEIDGVKAYHSVDELPPTVKSLIVMTKKDKTLGVIKSAIDKGIENIWIQQMSETPEAIRQLEGTNVNVISKQCIHMFYHPHSIHKFHRNIKKFFGRLPK